MLHLNKKNEPITILKNETNNHRLLQIDLNLLADNEKQLEDVYDIIAVELRKGEGKTPWNQVKQQLLKKEKDSYVSHRS